MIDWQRKIIRLAKMIQAREPIDEIREFAEKVLILRQMEQETRSLFIAWQQGSGTKEEKQQQQQKYLDALHRAQNYSDELQTGVKKWVTWQSD